MSAADQAAMDRRMKLELWKAQKEAAKGQVCRRCVRPRAALASGACGVECEQEMLADSWRTHALFECAHVRFVARVRFVKRICPTRGRMAAVPHDLRAR